MSKSLGQILDSNSGTFDVLEAESSEVIASVVTLGWFHIPTFGLCYQCEAYKDCESCIGVPCECPCPLVKKATDE